jgi:hypothetical protein
MASPEDRQIIKDPLELPVAAKVQGHFLKAFVAAYDSFKSDSMIPDSKKRIENYEIEFRQQSNWYFVLFFAKRNERERELLGGESELGKDVMYTIRKEDFSIVEKKFFK